MRTSQPLKPTKVRSRLVERLRDALIEGTYKPGDRLVERELCEQFEVSRPSLREALRQLEAEGLVDIIPHRGPSVRVIDPQEIMALWDLRLEIGGLAARRFAELGTVMEMDDFEARVKEHATALAARDRGAIKSTKSALFDSFAAGAHNEPLVKIFRQINSQLSFSWATSLQLPGRPQESVHELFTLLAAIRQRNVNAAHAAFLLYIEHARAGSMVGVQSFQRDIATGVPEHPRELTTRASILHAE